MIHHNHRAIPYYTFASFDRQPGLLHAVFTRHGGVSPSPWHSLNLGWTVGDEHANVEANYHRWAAAFGLQRRTLTTTWQVHGRRILLAGETQRNGSLGKADGLITRTPGIPLVQRYADCTPVLVYDPVQRACGIAHAGWQGTVAGCAAALVQAMQDSFGSEPAGLIAAIGPAIGPCCYEIGPEVAHAVRSSQPNAARLLRPTAGGHAYLDLWQANAGQLRDAGVHQVEVAGLCTACHRDTFYSHRGDRGRTGRFAAFIMIA